MKFHYFVVVDVSLYSRLLKNVGDEVVDWLCLSDHGRQGVGLVSKAMPWSTPVNDPGPSGFHVFSVGPRLNSVFQICKMWIRVLENNFVVKSEFGNKFQT